MLKLFLLCVFFVLVALDCSAQDSLKINLEKNPYYLLDRGKAKTINPDELHKATLVFQDDSLYLLDESFRAHYDKNKDNYKLTIIQHPDSITKFISERVRGILILEKKKKR